ncbi:MAG: Ig-like domain-containing protein [Verrucomicrobiota bacterium]|jgi:plastocyanin
MKMMRNTIQLIIVSTCVTLFGHALPSFAATVIVNVGTGAGADVFVPATNNINVNDQVIWNWVGSEHSTTSGTNGVHGEDNGVPSGLWDSGVHNPPNSFTNTFTSAGAFLYYCSIHFSVGMKGLINVAAATVPPTISITNPPNGATFSAPASFTLAATVSDSDGTVTNVQFLNGASSLSNVTSSPYSIPVSSLATGDYALSAIATDNNGLSATNAITVHVVTPAPIVISGPVFLSSSDFEFSYTANAGLSYVVQQSPDLINWTGISTNVAAGSPVPFEDTNATGNPRFYRVGLLPNP